MLSTWQALALLARWRGLQKCVESGREASPDTQMLEGIPTGEWNQKVKSPQHWEEGWRVCGNLQRAGSVTVKK